MRSLAVAAVALAVAAFANRSAAVAQALPPAASPSPTASPVPLPAPLPQPAPVVTPSAAPTVAPVPTAAPLPAPTPSPTATPAASPFHYVIDPPATGTPAILEVAVNDRVLHPGGPYIVRVTTTLDVASVEVDAMGASYGLPPAGPGRFYTAGSVPSEVPFFLLNRSYTLTVVAETGDGRTSTIQVPMRLER
jgi:hypothetical protein